MADYFNHKLLKKNKVERRLYQETLLASCIKQNSLIILPTGLGKTIIAALMATLRLSKYPDNKIIFLAPTKPLVVQHKNTFEGLMNIDPSKLMVLTGTISPEKRKAIYKEASIIFITPQTLQNDIIRGLSLEDVSLIIFDEAHRAIGDYPYPFIANQYTKMAKKSLILGITASPGAEEEKIIELLMNMNIQHEEARTDSSLDVKEYIHETKIEWQYVDLPEKFEKLRELTKAEVKKSLKVLKDNSLISTIDLKKVTSKDFLGIQRFLQGKISKGDVEPIVWDLIKVNSMVIKFFHMLNLIETQGLAAFKDYLKKIALGKTKSDQMILNSPFFEEIEALAQDLLEKDVEHPKIELLKRLVEEQFQENEDSRIIVFVHFRNSAKKVTEELSNSSLIRPIRFVGQATKKGDKGLKQKEQIEIIQNFKDGLYNVLIATSVAEEGLDISEVDLVIFYDTVPSSVRTIQRRGRTGRKKEGRVIILMAKGTKDEGYFYVAKHKEKKMKENIKKIQKISKKFNEEQMKLKKTKSLESFFPEKDIPKKEISKDPKVKIIVDSRETASSVVRELKSYNCDLEIQKLEVGDYIVSDRVAIERKSTEDFVASIIDGRLWNELIDLSTNYEIPILLLEGEPPQSNKRIHLNAILGALSSILIKFRMPTIYSRDTNDTARLLMAFAKKEQVEKKRKIKLRHDKATTKQSEIVERIVAGIPGIDLKRSQSILDHFKTLNNVFKQENIDELIKIEGIGKKIANDILEISHFEYEKDEEQENE